MSMKWVAFFVFVWLSGALLGAIMDQSYIGAGEESCLNKMAFWQQIQEEEDFGVFTVIGAPVKFFTGLWEMVTFKFSFLEGTDWELYRWFVLGPLIVAFIFGAILTLMGIFKGTGT